MRKTQKRPKFGNYNLCHTLYFKVVAVEFRENQRKTVHSWPLLCRCCIRRGTRVWAAAKSVWCMQQMGRLLVSHSLGQFVRDTLKMEWESTETPFDYQQVSVRSLNVLSDQLVYVFSKLLFDHSTL